MHPVAYRYVMLNAYTMQQVPGVVCRTIHMQQHPWQEQGVKVNSVLYL